MKRRKILYGSLLLGVTFLSGCASKQAIHILATLADSGKHITLQRNQKLVIELPKNENKNINWTLTEMVGDVMHPPVKQEIQLITNPVSMVRYVFVPKYIGVSRIHIVENDVQDGLSQQVQDFELVVSVVP